MTTKATTEKPDVQPLADDNTVVLDTPIRRGVTIINSITLRKPASGELRGVNLVELASMDVESLIKILPRITIPGITGPEVAGMDPADLVALASKVCGFLSRKSAKTDASLVA